MTANATKWTKLKPKQPGWYWYVDDDYGPAPVYMNWIGPVSDDETRELIVDQCVGENQELLGCDIADLEGRWLKLNHDDIFKT